MKRIILAVVAVASLGLMASTAALATNEPNNDPRVWVCKYVGKPGEDERLKEGKNPIIVSSNVTVGTWFKDGQDNSYVLDVATDENTGQGETYIGTKVCPDGSTPPPPTLATGVIFNEATCTSGPSFTFVRTTLEGFDRPMPFYSIEGPLVGGKPVAGASYTITAVPVDGYEFTGQTVWTHTFAAAPSPTECNPPTPTPTPTPTPEPECPDNPGGVAPNPPGGQDGNPGNDRCKPDETPTPTPTPTPVPPTSGSTTPPVPPVVAPPAATPKPTVPKATPKPDKPKPVAKPTKPATAPKPASEPTVAPKDETLPYTGVNALAVALAGLALVGGGLGMRRLGS